MTASEDERADVKGAKAPDLRAQPEPDPAAVTDPDTEPATEVTDTVAPESAKRAKPVKAKKKASFWKELPILIVIALVLTFLIQTFVARVYVIPSGSMELTLNGCTGCVGDRILVDRITYDFTSPSPGDVVVFKGPPGWDQSEYNVSESSNVVVRWLREFGSSIGIGSPPEYDLVKRVIAVGGQTVACCDSHDRVTVDGKPLNEPYIYWEPGTAPVQHAFPPVKVPSGDLWVMGDNRNDSFDSRYQNGGGIRGVVPAGNVIGIARVIIWPPGRWRGIGEINSQTLPFAMGVPTLPGVLPLGVGALGAFPTLWLGRRFRVKLMDRLRRGERR